MAACGLTLAEAWRCQRSTTVTVTEPGCDHMENNSDEPCGDVNRAHPSTLVVNRELLRNGQSATDSRSARHIELELPAGMEYQTGDHLGVLPRNDVNLIRRVMARFGLDAGTYVTINPTGGGTYTTFSWGNRAALRHPPVPASSRDVAAQ